MQERVIDGLEDEIEQLRFAVKRAERDAQAWAVMLVRCEREREALRILAGAWVTKAATLDRATVPGLLGASWLRECAEDLLGLIGTTPYPDDKAAPR